MVKLNSGGNYLKTADVTPGDQIKFLDEGEWVENPKYQYPDGNNKMDFIMKVEHNGEEKKWRVNKTNRDIMCEAYGNDTVDWINTTAKASIENVLVGGKRLKTIILEPTNGKTFEKVDESIAWDE